MLIIFAAFAISYALIYLALFNGIAIPSPAACSAFSFAVAMGVAGIAAIVQLLS